MRLSASQARRYMHRWGYSKKKTQGIHIKKASIAAVRSWRYRTLKKIQKYRKLGYTIVTEDEGHFKDMLLTAKYWAKVGIRILMSWTGGHHKFSMFCSMTDKGRMFFHHCKTANTDSFLEHIKIVYAKVGKMVLIMDKASYHRSEDIQKFLREHRKDIIVIWYPTGHPYLNPVEEVWYVLKKAVEHSVRYGNLNTHLQATYDFIGNGSKFNYDFKKFLNRKPPKGIIRPFIKSERKPDPVIAELEVGKKRPARKRK